MTPNPRFRAHGMHTAQGPKDRAFLNCWACFWVHPTRRNILWTCRLPVAQRRALLQDQYGDHIDDKDVLSAALYPSVFKEYQDFRYHYGNQMTNLPTRAFLAPLREDEEITVEVAPGSAVTIKFKAKGELQENGKREVFFETFGVPRVFEVVDKGSDAAKRVVREKADSTSVGSVGAPMGGDVLEVCTLGLTALELGCACMHARVT
jgi:pyruvate carboxylase